MQQQYNRNGAKVESESKLPKDFASSSWRRSSNLGAHVKSEHQLSILWKGRLRGYSKSEGRLPIESAPASWLRWSCPSNAPNARNAPKQYETINIDIRKVDCFHQKIQFPCVYVYIYIYTHIYIYVKMTLSACRKCWFSYT
jgi:hypothetical protein